MSAIWNYTRNPLLDRCEHYVEHETIAPGGEFCCPECERWFYCCKDCWPGLKDAALLFLCMACEALASVDYWCRDCIDWFRAERTPVHAPPTPCPKCGGKNTYEAQTE